MANLYPQELLDIQKTIQCVENCYSSWMNGTMNDKNYASKMGDFLEMLKHDMASFKSRYRREAKAILEIAGGE